MWDNFTYGTLFPRLVDEKIDENIMETYQNIMDSMEDLGEEGNKLGRRTGEYLLKIVEKWSDESEREFLSGKVGYRRRERVSMRDYFEYLYGSLEVLRGNYFVMFMERVVDVDFSMVVEEECLLDSLQFIQRLLRVLNGVRDVHRKRKRIMRERMNLGVFIRNRRYF